MYQDGKLNTQKKSQWNAYIIMSTATIFWYLVIEAFYYYDIKNVNLPENPQALGFLVLILILVIFYFLLYNQHEKIYNQFCHLNRLQRKIGLIISFSYFLLPIFVGAFITLRWHGDI